MRRPVVSLVTAASLAFTACGGSDDGAPAESDDSSVDVPDESSDDGGDSGDDGDLVAGYEPIALRVSLPGGGRISADADAVAIRAEPLAEPSREVPWTDLVDVARRLEASGVNAVSCLEPGAIRVSVEAPDQITFVSGSVCDGMPEYDAVRAALAPLELAIGSGVLDVENGRLPASDLETGGDNEVTYYFERGAEFIELTVTEMTAEASTDSGNIMIALSLGDFTALVEALRSADLSEDSSDCAGGPTNGVSVTLDGEETLVRNNNPCDDDTGFVGLNEAVTPLLERMGLDAPS